MVHSSWYLVLKKAEDRRSWLHDENHPALDLVSPYFLPLRLLDEQLGGSVAVDFVIGAHGVSISRRIHVAALILAIPLWLAANKKIETT